MAMMKYREANHALWRGARPGHDGTEFFAYIDTALVANHIVFTSPAATTTYITNIWITTSDNLVQEFMIQIYNNVPASVGIIYWGRCAALYLGDKKNMTYWPPIEFPAAWSLRVNILHAQICTFGCRGWRE